MDQSMASWSDLPQELLRIVMAGLADPTDQACFRAVCRSWRCVPSPRKLPSVVLPTGFLLVFTRDGFYRDHPFPGHGRCIASTDSFLAMDTPDDHNRHTYKLINPCSVTVVELRELDAILGNVVSKSFEIHKVLMHDDGLVAVRTNNRIHPLILVKPGKGAWLPKPRHKPFTKIIDVAFLGDTLYGITQAENLISFSLAFDSQGAPMVTSVNRVITGSVVNVEKDASRKRTGNYIVNDGMHFARDDEWPSVRHIVTIWYLVESHGKLLMVRRKMQRCFTFGSTRKVEVFEADFAANKWLPVLSGLHGHALFLSKRSSKSVLAGDEIEEDAIYFIDTGEVFNMRSKTTSAPDKSVDFNATWLFYSGYF